jgi:hypothetical protein
MGWYLDPRLGLVELPSEPADRFSFPSGHDAGDDSNQERFITVTVTVTVTVIMSSLAQIAPPSPTMP